jgi:hypothetical protein
MIALLVKELEDAKAHEEICRRTMSKLSMVATPYGLLRFYDAMIDAIEYTYAVQDRLNAAKEGNK